MVPFLVFAHEEQPTIPIHRMTEEGCEPCLTELGPCAKTWASMHNFRAQSGRMLAVPDREGRIACVLLGLGAEKNGPPSPFLAGHLSGLPEGCYHFAESRSDDMAAALAFVLGSYHYGAYTPAKERFPRLKLPGTVDGMALDRIIRAVFLVRDLVNTPANALGPEELSATLAALAARHGASLTELTGDDLLKHGFALIHAVGHGSERLPRLVDFSWGDPAHPKVTLVGKGVIFDTGGLDIKSDTGMRLMKKDMGGAAHVAALAQMVMEAGLKLRLRVIVPIVENAISGRAFRPGDIIRSRKGLTVEIGNTDAEGRLILADALALADEEAPDLLIDLATLTGAARVALGPDLPAVYSDDEALITDLSRHAASVHDPFWRMPLYRPYADSLAAKTADLCNISGTPFAGSIMAALFLNRFVERAKSWLHADIFAWTPTARPGRPEGGEAQMIRALFSLLQERYSE